MDTRSRDYETWVNDFLAEMRDGKSARSGSGGTGGSGGGGSGGVGGPSTGQGTYHGSGGLSSDEMARKKKAIRDLQHHLNQELADQEDEQKKNFLGIVINKLFGLINSSDLVDLKSGLALMCIILDAPSLQKIKINIQSPFVNYYRKVIKNLKNLDLELFDLIACVVGRLALNAPSTLSFVDFEINLANENLRQGEQINMAQRHSFLLNIRELANVAPSYFFGKVEIFFDSLFFTLNEPKLREPAISCLRSTLAVIVERERLFFLPGHHNEAKQSRIDQQIPLFFSKCYVEVVRGLCPERAIEASLYPSFSASSSGGSTSSKQQAKDREEKVHSSLLILNELFRCSRDSSVLLNDSVSRELDFLYINQADFNETNSFYLTNYLFSHFDYSGLSSMPPLSLSHSVSSSALSSSVGSSSTATTAATASAVSAAFRSTNLTNVLRNAESSACAPLYGMHGLHSVVNHHKESGIAPILTLFKKSKPSLYSTVCDSLLSDHFEEIVHMIIEQLRAKNSQQVTQVLLLILPSLISFDPTRFCARKSNVADCINYLLACVKNNNTKSLAFISLGLFALAVKEADEGDGVFNTSYVSESTLTVLTKSSEQSSQTKSSLKSYQQHPSQAFDQHLPLIVQQIRAAFPSLKDGHLHQQSNSKKRSALMPDPAVFTCIAFLAQAVDQKVRADIFELLPAMFALGLTEPLVNSLYDICLFIPELRTDIHEGLLRMLSQIIMGKKLELPKSLCINPLITHVAYPPNEVFDLATVKYALKVLGRFDFAPQFLIHFVRTCADVYLSHESREIRLEAVHTCCRLLTPFLERTAAAAGRHEPRSIAGVEPIIKDVLSKLIIVGITDLDKYVRYSVLSRLEEHFDYYLAQAENLELLMLSLYDEVFEIRELGICIMGRLCSLNPAYVMPYLRKVLLELLTELETSGVPRSMEQSARMLGHLLAATPRLIRPYTEPILKVFLPKLTDPSQAVTTAIMSAIGEQAIVSGLEMRAWFYELFPIILEAVQDSSSLQKREIALWTMGRLIENCGYVIEPYWKFPALMDILFSLLKLENSKQSALIRRETMRVLGLLGAVDPYRHKIHLGVIDLSGESLISCDPAEEAEINIHEMLSNISGNFDEFYCAQAINTLVMVMKDTTATAQHTMAVQAVYFIFSVLKLRSVPYLPHILPPFINIIRTGEFHIKEYLLQKLGQIIGIVRKHIRVYLDDIFKVLRELWTSNETIQLVLFSVIEQIVAALGGEFGNYAPHLIPHILKVLNQDSGSREVLMKLFGALQSFGSNLEDYVSLLVPPICAQFETSTRKDVEVRIAALRTIEVLCDDLELKDHSTRIVHAIVRTIDNNPHDKRLVNAAMDTLIKYTFQLGMHYRIYIPIVDSVLAKHRLSFVYYEQVVQNIKSGQFTEEQDVNNLTSGVAAENSRRRFNARRARELVHQNQQQSPSGDIAKNRTANNTLDDIRLGWVDYPRRISTEDWLEWLRKFNLDLINNSPAFSLRACYHIAQTCNTVARDLFNPAFLTHWNDLNTEKQKDFIESFQDVLKQQEIPEVTGILLNLAEFLEHIDVQNGNPLFDAEVLGERALKCRAYAKALHYKEKEFSLKKESGTPVGPDVLGSLITINNKLQQAQAAYGVLTYAMRSYEAGQLQLKERWFEKLNNFESAFFAHRLKFDQNNNDMEAVLGQMRCLEVLSEWDRLYGLVNDYYSHAEADRERMARMAVTATWNLNKWGEMESYVKQLPADSSDSAFFQAVIKVREEDYGQAQHFIDTARLLVDNELTTMAGESYSRAYPAMLSVQLMSELEEVMQYRLVPERREMIKQKWWHRLQGLQSSVDDWKKVLQVRSLVLSPREDMRSWLKFAKLCDRQQRYNLSFKTIVSLMGVKPNKLFRVGEPLPLTFPEVTLKFINHLWMAGHIFRAYRELDRFLGALESPNYLQGATFAYYTSSVSPMTPTGTEGHYSGLVVDPQQQQQQFASVATSFAVSGDVSPYSNATTAIGGGGGGSRVSPATSLNFATNAAVAAATAASTTKVPVVVQKLLSRAYLKMAKEQEFLVGFSSRSIPTILENLQKATERDKHYYKAWHAWAFYNFRALKYCKDRKPELRTNLELPVKYSSRRPPLVPKDFCIQAVRGFFRSVTLSPQQQSMQDTLRILTLWFDDGYNADVRAALEEGIKNVSIETWLQVIPQLIARIDAPHQSVAKLIHTLLTDIGKYHPQALIYPLTVANKSAVSSRSTAANSILHLMKVHSPNLVKQAILVSEELIRIAILWHELWHEGLEEASRLYFGDKNIDGMFETLEPLHKLLESTPLTLKEHTFCQNYGADLSKAHSYCRKYKLDPKKDPRNLNQAWDIYYHVFRRISRQLPQLTSLELQFVSPKLTECTDLELAVPGSYNPRQELICIAKVEPQLNIITSKQRPRKLTIKGSNGRNYMFLLKGHEDLRQDERVMQLFGLVNTLLNKEHNTSKQNLAIQRYAVIPLSPNSGLIGWVPHCDTLHSLIRDYREKRKILLNMEHRLMLRVGPDYDRLNLMQKVEVFEHALECTPGDDLAKILWLKSPNSEVWFDRRTNYTRSLAVMSMVGYILGLGDRHPSNLMLDRMSGKILHIDFGDCFEVAMNREKYPEKIPFRLTRMLINAMEITGLDGTFTTTCRNVMNVMRKHKESLMALLEAFLYDPLLNWRLIEAQPKAKLFHHGLMPGAGGAGGNAAGAGGANQPTMMMNEEEGMLMHNFDGASEAAAAQQQQQQHQQQMQLQHQRQMQQQQEMLQQQMQQIMQQQEPGGNGNGGGGGGGGGDPIALKRPVSSFRQQNLERKLHETMGALGTLGGAEGQLNSKAVAVVERVRHKLTGLDFENFSKAHGVIAQVDMLIKSATSHENLCQCYIGWCPFW